jgi:hypothetical protein
LFDAFYGFLQFSGRHHGYIGANSYQRAFKLGLAPLKQLGRRQAVFSGDQ